MNQLTFLTVSKYVNNIHLNYFIWRLFNEFNEIAKAVYESNYLEELEKDLMRYLKRILKIPVFVALVQLLDILLGKVVEVYIIYKDILYLQVGHYRMPISPDQPQLQVCPNSLRVFSLLISIGVVCFNLLHKNILKSS